MKKRAIPILFLLLSVFLLSSCSARLEEEIHTVTFYDGFGGTSVQYVADGKTAVKPYKDPVASAGCGKGSFRAWVTKEDSGMETVYDFSQSVKRDISLYAVYWDSVTVYFYDSDNTLLGTQSVSSDTDFRITRPSDPVSKSGNKGRFRYWKLYDSTEWDFNSSISTDINLYAVYAELHTVTYYNGDNIYWSEKVSDGECASGPETDPVSSGRGSLLGWSTEHDGDEKSAYSFTSPVTEDISLYAYYRDARYVTLEKPDGTEIETVKIDYLSLFPVPEMTQIDDSIIKSWQKKNDDGTYSDYDFTRPVEDSITLRAVSYDKINTVGGKKEVLSMMKFAEVLSSCTGDREGTDTVSGFTKAELIQLFLAASKLIDEDTLSLTYTTGNTDYFFYDPETDLTAPGNILYVDIEKAGYTRFTSGTADGRTRITATDFSVTANAAPGKVENGSVVKDGDYFESSSTELVFAKITLVSDGRGNFELTLISTDGSSRTLKAGSVITDEGTTTTFIHTKTGSSGSVEETAAEMTFCTVTFDSRNGDGIKTERRLKGKTVQKPDEKPKDAYGSESTFEFWSLDGETEYGFSSSVDKNITLEAVYTSRDEFTTLLEAECIYRIPTILSSSVALYTGATAIDDIFPQSSSSDSDYDLMKVLLSSLISINSNEKLSVPYDGKEYVYDGNEINYQIYRLSPSMSIEKNSSMKNGNTTKIKVEEITIALQAKYFEGGTRKWFLDSIRNTFSIEADITQDASGKKTMTTVLTVGEKTYPVLRTTSTPTEGGGEKVEFEYKGKTFTRTY